MDGHITHMSTLFSGRLRKDEEEREREGRRRKGIVHGRHRRHYCTRVNTERANELVNEERGAHVAYIIISLYAIYHIYILYIHT